MAVVVDSAYLISNQIISDMMFYRDVLSVIGLFYVGKSAFSLSCKLFSGFRTHILSKIWHTKKFPLLYGKWAVIVNGSDGFGKAYAGQLAARGMNILLVGSDMETLRTVTIEFEREYGVETDCIEFNCDDPDPLRVCTNLYFKLRHFDAGILVNSIPIKLPEPAPLERIKKDIIFKQLNQSIILSSMVTWTLIPGMKKTSKGAIVNISSIVTCSPNAYRAVSSGIKSYIENFSRSMEEECKQFGVHVQTLCPGFISQSGNSLLVPSVDTYVRHAVSTLPFSNYTTGYWLHSLQAWFLSCLPERLRPRFNDFVRRVGTSQPTI